MCGTENADGMTSCTICGAYKPEAATRRVTQAREEREGGIRGLLVIEIVKSPIEQLVGRRFEFAINSAGASITVGRAVENNIVIPDPTVSRRHIRLVITPDGVMAEDLGSTNGTFVVNGTAERRLRVDRIPSGATLRLGNTLIRVLFTRG